ncbi:camphor resistance protein CrcB [Nocardioides albertanoniae]|uniref:Fluoride-specific ion channel FluC n=1 Tax=Nocardioides albertanoniae TaxID=1175486 RepID=A0A543A1B6_9ACTN|nr:fluoride efflux transporter CrcB [Nocardioides albertanoniae]TQL66379.1 camphor resistance protein CrcB [Nocardioides albertanoniae]
MIGFLFVLVGAAIGAPARYLIDRSIQARHQTLMPWGTMTVNIVGTTVLGLLAGLDATHDVPHNLLLGLGIGICGALTTFSTYVYESVRLYETGARTQAVLNMVVSLAAGLGAVTIGYSVGTAL